MHTFPPRSTECCIKTWSIPFLSSVRVEIHVAACVSQNSCSMDSRAKGLFRGWAVGGAVPSHPSEAAARNSRATSTAAAAAEVPSLCWTWTEREKEIWGWTLWPDDVLIQQQQGSHAAEVQGVQTSSYQMSESLSAFLIPGACLIFSQETEKQSIYSLRGSFQIVVKSKMKTKLSVKHTVVWEASESSVWLTTGGIWFLSWKFELFGKKNNTIF